MRLLRIQETFFCFLVCINLFGCVGIGEYYVSQPMDIGSGYKFWPENEIVVFNLEDIKLYVQVQNTFAVSSGGMLVLPIPIMEPRKEVAKNYRKSTYLFKEAVYSVADVVEGDYFYIEILMRIQKDGFFFNPREVYLELENGEYLQASKYLKPNIQLGSPSMVVGPLLRTAEYSWRTEKNEQTRSEYFKLPLKEYVGFAIRFETQTPNPGIPFNIVIKGVRYFENSVPIQKIRYKDKKICRDYRTS